MSGALHFSSGANFYGEKVKAPHQQSCASKRPLQRRRVYCYNAAKKAEQGRIKLSDVPHDRRVNKRWPLTDDGARRVIQERKTWESRLRKNQPGARAVPWIRRSPSQMAQFLANGRTDLRFNKHVDKAIRTISKLASKPRSSYDFGVVMNPWVGSFSFKDMCIILREQKNWVQACDFFHWMKLQGSYIPSIIPYTILLRICGKAEKFDLVESYYTEMLEAGCEPDEVVICSLICMFAKSGRIDNMMNFYSMMRSQGLIPPIVCRGFPADEVIYGTIISIYSKLGMYLDAESAFKEADEAGLVVSERLFVLMASVRMKAVNFSLALQLFDEMQSRGFEMTKYAWIIVLQCCSKQQKVTYAESAFEVMVNRGFADAVAYTCMLNLYKRMQMFEAGKVLLLKLEHSDVEPDEELSCAIIDFFCSADMLQQAECYLAEMQMKGLVAGRTSKSILMRAYGKAGRHIDAESLFNSMDNVDVTSILLMFNIYDSSGRKEEAMTLSKHLLECDVKTYDRIVYKYAKQGAVDMVVSLCSQMITLGVMPSEDTFSFVIGMFGEKEQCQEALKLFKQCCKSGLRFSQAIYSLMMEICIKCGEEKEADHLLKSMQMEHENVTVDLVLEAE